MFDTHIHLGSIEKSALEKLLSIPGRGYLSCGFDRKSSISAAELSREHSNVWCAVGVHPQYINDIAFIDEMEVIISSESRMIAIGEAGLDARYPDMEGQKKAFERQIVLAERKGLPIIVHNVRATDEIIRMIKSYPKVRYIMHGFSGSPDTARELLLHDVYFGIGRAVTYENVRRLAEALKVIPGDRFLIETDDPFMGSDTVTDNLGMVLRCLASLLDMDEEKLEYLTDRNAQEAFGL